MLKLNKLNKLKNKTQKTTCNKIQYGGQIDETYINNVFEYIYNDMFVEDLNLKHNSINKNEYIKNNILDYEFFNKSKLKDKNKHSQYNEHEDIYFDLKLYDEWVAERFNLTISEAHIRIIDNVPNSIHSPSTNHREFNNDPMGCGNTWNVLCYYKNINCNLYNSGLGIIYKLQFIFL